MKKKLPYYLAAFLITALLFSSCFDKKSKEVIPANLKLVDLKCEYASNPLGLDELTPQFSWRIESPVNGVSQKAYQLIVAESPEKLNYSDSLIWDSGKTKFPENVGVKYCGPSLESRKQYFWKVKIWDSSNNLSSFSETAFFEMGLLKKSDWQADWIGSPISWAGRVLYFRYDFSISKPIKKARVYISGIGYYELFINSKKVGNNILDPGTTSYSKRVLYTTYDVTPNLKATNTIGVTVGPGWYGMSKLFLQSEITYVDGTSEVISTNKKNYWMVTIGPIIKSSIYDGEEYDARDEKPGCGTVEGELKNIDQWNNWTTAVAVDAPGGSLVSQQLEPIQIVDSLLPQSISEPLAGKYFADVGKNMAGWAAIKVKGKRGTKITLKFGEVLYENGLVNQENLNLAKATDTYILKGDGEEIWQPSFTYHGFRYIQIEGFPYRPKSGDICIKVVRSAVKNVGSFKCSNELLNNIHKMVVATESSNLHSIPTDCPQRAERMGWLNDLTVRIDQAVYNFDLARFYSKYINDIEDTQELDGTITDTSPFHWGNRPADPVSVSYLLLALKSYVFYGNKNILIQHYNGLKAWVDFLNSKTENGIVTYSYYGDWAPPIAFGVDSGPKSKFTPGTLMSTGYLYYSAKILSQIAHIINKKSDAVYYEKLASSTANAFNNKFWDKQTGGYGSNNQACNSFALFLGLVEKENESTVIKNIVDDVEKHEYHLTTGNLCTKYLLEVLTEHGYVEVAYKIVNQQSYPSWGFMLCNGATTLWERWENCISSGMNSHNHPMMGSVDSWFYKYLVGINPDNEVPGFEKFTIRPYVIADLQYVEGEFNSVAGKIKSSWHKSPGSIILNVTIPGNTLATVYIPSKKNRTGITEKNRKINSQNEFKFLRREGNYALYEVKSGSYEFKSDW